MVEVISAELQAHFADAPTEQLRFFSMKTYDIVT